MRGGRAAPTDPTRSLGRGDRWWNMADSAEPAARSLRCDVRRIGDELWFFGEVDETNADDLTARAVAEIRDGTVCLDLSQVRFFGAAGTRMMFAARAAAAAVDGQVRVVC